MRPIVLAFLFVSAVAALTAAADDAPRFPIDAITVEGVKYSSPNILIAESKIVEGQTYTEPQLRDAVARINRLPFVLHTDFRLEKGSERGRYVLVISIIETRPLFLSYRMLYEGIDTFRVVGFERDPVTGQPVLIREKTLFRHNEESASIGGRYFLGAKGMLYASFERNTRRYNLGYTQYDLFGTRASINALLQYREYSFDLPDFVPGTGRRTTSFTDHLAWDVTGAIPLSGNNAIRATWHRERQPYLIPTDDGPKIIRLVFDHPEVAWVHDSTDDPLFPTSGAYVKAGIEGRKVGLFRNNEFERVWHHELTARATKYVELTPAQSFNVGAELHTVENRKFREYDLRVGYAASLFPDTMRKLGELRFEAQTERIILDYDPTTSYGTARLGLALRNTWGVARFDVQYVGWRHRF